MCLHTFEISRLFLDCSHWWEFFTQNVVMTSFKSAIVNVQLLNIIFIILEDISGFTHISFLVSGDAYRGFQNQCGSLTCILHHLCTRDSTEPTSLLVVSIDLLSSIGALTIIHYQSVSKSIILSFIKFKSQSFARNLNYLYILQ